MILIGSQENGASLETLAHSLPESSSRAAHINLAVDCTVSEYPPD